MIYVGTLSKTLSPTLRLGYLVVPTSLCRAFAEAKRLTDRHTPLLEQDALADLLASGAYERHVRSIRRKKTERRTVLLQSLGDNLGASVTIAGADTGLHVVIWIDGVASDREPMIIEAARTAGSGLYPLSPLPDQQRPILRAPNSVVATKPVSPGFTAFPTAIGLAATGDPEALQEMADIMRRQMRAVGMLHALAPVMDVARDARWGRVTETYGEDPYLVSSMSVAFTRGMQANDLREGVLVSA
ncbi:Glycosyl hydrolase family 3 N terminal domain-containing protein [Mesorhizobium albiziae]|uniref:Glycosyl hydrolase family 3 N terminal domain-containing protein n=1 Tax=Neomesorhizobium albiziae TaxID=335020 RepID=A0A1I4EVL3_9HYPH|nr:hypothetical protein GCM10007937_51820 [Mesorhizobium albiziae]SFL09785.1 Glycosyl hydrolase family 3 N terminal domain-containing protein [Mesorhizobium albiziae]